MLELMQRSEVDRVCAWCGEKMGLTERRATYRFPVTHGMCGTCSHLLATYRDVNLDQLINRLEQPVLVVDELTSLVVTANEPAAAAFGKPLGAFAGERGGSVTECVNAYEPGGCGEAEHCTGCTIRHLVMETASSGRGEDRAIAYQHRVGPDGIRKQHYLISTEKLEDLILLRMELLPEGDQP